MSDPSPVQQELLHAQRLLASFIYEIEKADKENLPRLARRLERLVLCAPPAVTQMVEDLKRKPLALDYSNEDLFRAAAELQTRQ